MANWTTTNPTSSTWSSSVTTTTTSWSTTDTGPNTSYDTTATPNNTTYKTEAVMFYTDNLGKNWDSLEIVWGT